MTESRRDPPGASRGPPPMIRPITINGITYGGVAGNAEIDGQAGGYLGAFARDGSLMWTVKIYDNKRIDGVEGDAQDVYFREMTLLPDGAIRIINEDDKRFRFDPRTRAVTALPSPVRTPRAPLLRPTRKPD